MKKKKSAKKWIIIAVILVVIAFVAVSCVRMGANIQEMMKTTYEISEAETQTIEVRVKGAGAVEPLNDEVEYASFTGSVDEVFVENGDVVSAGDVIATFTSDTLEQSKEQIEQQIEEIDQAIGMMYSAKGSDTVRSAIAGNVKEVYAEVGDNVDVVVDAYGALAVLCPDELMQVTLATERDVKAGDALVYTAGDVTGDAVIYQEDEETGEIVVRFNDDGLDVGTDVIISSDDGTIIGENNAEIANPVYITAQGGTVEKVYKEAGEDVSRGGSLFKLDGEILSADLYTQIEQRKELEDDLAEVNDDLNALNVKADIGGVISGLNLNPQQIVQEGTPLFTIESNDAIKMDVEIDELDIANIEIGQKAEVEFDALPDDAFEATVVKINPVGVSVNNVTNFTITLEVEQNSAILLGMSADVEIISQRAENVLAIPQEAIQIIDGEKMVVFEEDIDEELLSTPATHKIETGITDGVMIEITSGLSEGDRVAVPQEKELTPQEMQQQMMMGGRASDESPMN